MHHIHVDNTDFETYINSIRADIRTDLSTPVFIRVLCATSILRTYMYIGRTSSSVDAALHVYSSYFLSELCSDGTINYHPRDSVHGFNYPDDIDDTCSALYVVSTINPSYINSNILARLLYSLDRIRIPHTPYLFNTWCTYRHNSSDLHREPQLDVSDRETLVHRDEYNHNNIDTQESIDITALSAVVAFFDTTTQSATSLKSYVYEQFTAILLSSSIAGAGDNFQSDYYHSIYLPMYLMSRISWSTDEVCTIIALYSRHIPDRHIIKNSEDICNACLIICTISKLVFSMYPLTPHTTEHNKTDMCTTYTQKQLHIIHQCINRIIDLYTYITSATCIDTRQHPHSDTQTTTEIDTSLDSSQIKLYIEKISHPTTISDEKSVIYATSKQFVELIAFEASHAFRYLQEMKSLITAQLTHTQQHTSLTHLPASQIPMQHSCISDKEICNSVYLRIHDLIRIYSEQDRITIRQTLISISKSIDYTLIRDILFSIPIQTQTSLSSITHQSLLETHLIGLFGYYLYDKIIDTEYSHIYLPVCIHCIQLFNQDIQSLTSHIQTEPSPITSYQHILQTIHEIHIKEIHRDISAIEDFSYKSIGIAILPLLICPEFKSHILPLLQTYQLVRQICDDITDHSHDQTLNKFTTISFLKRVHNVIDWEYTEQYLKDTIHGIRLSCNALPSTNEQIHKITHILMSYVDALEQNIKNMCHERKVRIWMHSYHAHHTQQRTQYNSSFIK